MQNYNIILETKDISEESAPVAEPVTLQEIKNYLRLEGFIDDSDSTSIDDFSDDNFLLRELIATARKSLEEKLGVSIVKHTWQAIGVTNQAGSIQLRYGPVNEITEILNNDMSVYDVSKIKSNGDYLRSPCDCNMTVTYEAGYDIIPSPIVTEIKRMVAYMYENRGDVDMEGYKYSSGVIKYSRKSWLE